MRAALVCLLFAAACGAVGETEKRLASGTYQLDRSVPGAGQNLGPLTLSLDVNAPSATITHPDGGTTALTLTATSRSTWIKDCYTNYSHTLNEVFDVSPAPLTVESVTITSPILTTKCGSSLLLGTPGGSGVTEPALTFTGPLTR